MVLPPDRQDRPFFSLRAACASASAFAFAFCLAFIALDLRRPERLALHPAFTRLANTLATPPEPAPEGASEVSASVLTVPVPAEPSRERPSIPPGVLAHVVADAPDVLVVLGARQRNGEPGRHMRQRLELALALSTALEDHPRLLLTGGKGEARAMAHYLVDRGVDPTRLILETRSRTTVQNARYSMAILERLASRVDSMHRVLIVTTAVRHRHRVDDHALRALAGFRYYQHHLQIAAVSVNSDPSIRPRFYGPRATDNTGG